MAIGYWAAHTRIRTARGPAKLLACIDCDGPATAWSYNHSDPNELTDERGTYSVDPVNYDPRCDSCHRKFDGRDAPGAVERRERTECPRGHPFDDENTYVHPTYGSRECRRCRSEATARYKQRQREKV